jgi:formate/nitrite transporter FocA (FNT family)
VSNLAATTTGPVVGGETWLVSVVNNTTGATLLSCTVTSSSSNSCSNSSASATVAAFANIEVKVTTNEILRLGMPWRVTFRY